MLIRFSKAAAVLTLLMFCSATHGVDKTKVFVKVSIVETSYVTQFTDASDTDALGTPNRDSLDWLEQRISDYVVARLNREFHFLEFMSATSQILTNDQYVLSVRLDQAAAATEAVGFHIGLDGPDSVQQNEYLLFRNDQAAGDALGDKEAFLTEIELKLSQSSFQGIGANLLKSVALSAEEATLMKSPLLGWTMPYTRSQLCIDQGSKIIVVNDIPLAGLGFVQRSYTATALAFSNPGESRIAQLNRLLITQADENQPRLADLQAAEPSEIVIEKIYIIIYRPIDQQSDCDPLISPADIDFRGES